MRGGGVRGREGRGNEKGEEGKGTWEGRKGERKEGEAGMDAGKEEGRGGGNLQPSQSFPVLASPEVQWVTGYRIP